MAKNVFVTRLHVRYDAKSFPEDLKFKTTGDTSNFQGRYILRHAYDGEMECDAAKDYVTQVNKRKDKEIKTLANLTGWSTGDIRDRIKQSGKGGYLDKPQSNSTWWNKLWPGD